jgi:hypothetical protein
MKNLKKYLVFIAIAAFMFACKKEHLQPGTSTNGAPVFSFTGIVNGMPVSLQSGINNYYMYSSYTQDINNVYNFTGALQPVGCNGCANTIKITINDYKASSIGAPAKIDSSLLIGGYTYLAPSGGSPVSFTVTYSPVVVGTDSTYIYRFGDGSTYSGTNGTQSHIYTHPGTYTVSLTAHFQGGTTDSAQTSTQPGSSGPTWTTKFFVVKNDTLTNTVQYCDSIIGGSAGNYKVQWNFGDGFSRIDSPYVLPYTFTRDTALHQFANVYPGKSFQVSAKITYLPTGAVSYDAARTFVKNDSSTNNTPSCYISNLNSTSATGIANPKALSNINITYADANGNVYTSANAKQSSSSFFQVQSVSNYQNNENNQTTKQLHIQFSCKLVDNHSDTIQITNGQAVIAVAYK